MRKRHQLARLPNVLLIVGSKKF